MGDYITLEDVESFTRIDYDETTTPTDTEINKYIDEAELLINQNTGRTWGVETKTEIYNNPDYNLLLKNYPVITVASVLDASGQPLDEGIDDDFTVDGDFIVFNPLKMRPSRVTVEYTSGYGPVRQAAAKLAMLLVVSNIKQSESTTGTNSKLIKVGPITIDKAIGVQTTLNLDSDMNKHWKSLRRLIR
jgi:hypothetical protein